MSGHPMPDIKWLLNEQEFIPDGDRVKAFVNPEDGTFGLVFETTKNDDKGVYTAIAFSDEGTARYFANIQGPIL
jgi:hypothetical protein